MPIVPAKCPQCGGQIEVNNEAEAAVCKFCGTPFIVEKAINNYKIQNATISAGVINITNEKDFVIHGGLLEKYNGNKLDVIIPNEVVKIGPRVFYNMPINSIKIPETVTVIDKEAFYGTNIKSIILPNNIQDFSLAGCKNLVSIKIPDSIHHIPSEAFKDCTNLSNIIFPKNIDRISYGAFNNCYFLKSIVIPNGVKQICDKAFKQCILLESIEIPDSVFRIDNSAFEGCTKLSQITCNKHFHAFEKTPYYINISKRKSSGLCQHCGGSFKGVFNKVCSKCGKPKDY